MKARADKFAKWNWVWASTSFGRILRPAHWFGSRKPLPTFQASLNSRGNVRQLSIFRPDPFTFMVASILFCCTFSNAAIEFECSGTLQFQTHVLAKQVTQKEAFHVYVRDDNWLIKIVQDETTFPSETNAMVLTYFSYNDDEYVKTVSYANERERIVHNLSANPSAPNVWRESPELLAITQAWIEKSAVPWADSRPGPPVLFYAFCSRSYLDSASNGHLIPPFMAGGRQMPRDDGLTEVLSLVNRSGHPPYLPEQISFMHEGLQRLGLGVTAPLPETWKRFTQAVFEVNSYTNISGLKLPLSFELKVFMPTRPSNKGEPPKPLLASTLKGVVTNAAVQCTLTLIEMKPSILMPLNINDKRLSYRGVPLPMRYSGTNWLSEEALAKLPHVQSAKYERDGRILAIEKSRNSSHPNKVRLLFLGTLLLVSAALIYLWNNRYHKYQTQPKQQPGNI